VACCHRREDGVYSRCSTEKGRRYNKTLRPVNSENRRHLSSFTSFPPYMFRCSWFGGGTRSAVALRWGPSAQPRRRSTVVGRYLSSSLRCQLTTDWAVYSLSIRAWSLRRLCDACAVHRSHVEKRARGPATPNQEKR
jgi:hypothetical protein